MIEPHHLQAAGIVLAYGAFCGATAWRWKRRQAPPPQATAQEDPYLVAYASQTGFAEQIANHTGATLRASGMPVQVTALEALDTAQLTRARRALFVVSTAGEGDAPDSAALFIRKVMGDAPDLSGLRYGLMALGDSSYVNYCAFGRQVDAWLAERGARPLFARIEVDNGDARALGHWQQQIGGAGAWEAPRFETWQLAERRVLNPGSAAAPAYHLALTPAGAMPEWRAGDIAVIAPRNAPRAVARLLAQLDLRAETPVRADEGATLEAVLAARRLPGTAETLTGLSAQDIADTLPALPHRDYSIASLPADGRLELLVRLMCDASGNPGLGSGWLTQHVAEGGNVALRLRRNTGFHPPADDRPLLLVGNGTGLAGLRAHLKAREAAGHRRNWLIFGERQRQHDFFHRAEIEAWQETRLLERVDLAFSRDQAARVYVQHILAEQAAQVREWVAQGAAIYVCGSLQGMAQGVDTALRDMLGAETLDTLAAAGRYRRDVY